VDPVAHTFAGAALAAAGLRRATPLAAAALVIGANAPDVDVFAMSVEGYAQLAVRRGWTHGVLALVLWPFVLTGLLLGWDRWVRRRRDSAAESARAGPLLLVTTIAVVSHPTLDWLNNYGLRWLMPFDGRWFYGDALFIIDPWIYLTLGGVLFLTYSRSRAALVRWGIFWVIASLLVLTNTELVPPLARAAWVAGLALLAGIRWRLREPPSGAVLERAAQAAVLAVSLYIVATVAASAAARAAVRADLTARGIGPIERVMVAPVAANPFDGEVVVATSDEYLIGRWSWLASPRFELEDEPVARPRGAAFEAASAASAARNYLTWARFPVMDTQPAPGGGVVVSFSDARYRDGERLLGPSVRLDRELKIVESLER
jgi:inner membrane protein